MQIALVEDNNQQRAYLKGLVEAWLQDHDPGGQLYAYPDCKSFLFAREDLTFDLWILDILLPDINGMDLARQLRAEGDLTPLVFLTGELSYVFEGYQVSALDYLLKPVGEVELDRVLTKAHALAQDQKLDLVLATEAGLISRPLSQIMYAEAQGKYLEIHINRHPQATEVIRIRESLETWGQAWPQGQTLQQAGTRHLVDVLVQPHRSYLVNLRWLAKLSTTALTMADGSVIPLARGRRQEVQAQYLAWCRRKAGPARP